MIDLDKNVLTNERHTVENILSEPFLAGIYRRFQLYGSEKAWITIESHGGLNSNLKRTGTPISQTEHLDLINACGYHSYMKRMDVLNDPLRRQ